MANLLDKLNIFYISDIEFERDRVKLDEEIMRDYGDMIMDNPAMGYILKECGII